MQSDPDVEDMFVGLLVDMFPGEKRRHLSSILKRSNFDLQNAIDSMLQTAQCESEGEQMPSDSCGQATVACIPEPALLPAAPNCRLVVLVGLPGSGKSTFAQQFSEQGWTVVCQDVLGTRRACEEVADAALAAGSRVVVDRTNIDPTQRAHWLRIARARGVGPEGTVCVHLDPPPRECERRVLAREGHPTLPPTPHSAGVVRAFRRALRRPREAEGFASVIAVRTDGDALRAARAAMG